MLDLISNGLGPDQVQLPALIGGNPLNQGAVSLTTSTYIMDT
jgi:hypothetical protein